MDEPQSVGSAADLPAKNPDAFPILSQTHIDLITKHGQMRRFDDGDDVWVIGEPMRAFFVVVRGAVEVFQLTGTGERHEVVIHAEGEFTGDIDLLSSNATVVGAKARGETETIEVPASSLRKLVVDNSELSDIILKAFLARRQELIASGLGSLTIIGSHFSPETFKIREFLERNSRPFEWIDIETDERVSELLDTFGVRVEETPIVLAADGTIARNPSVEEIARRYGLSQVDATQIFDVIVVGAGPAGLASAVYAASEGLTVLIVDSVAPGGQASTSSKIENYLGFPTGISGRELAQRAFLQAKKFGAEVAAPREVRHLDVSQKPYSLDIGEGQSVRGRTVVLATGAHYRRLNVGNARQYEGRGIYFGATFMEAQMCRNAEVVIVGGGNSAGQAAVFLSQYAKHVHIAIRSKSLEHSMSKYLIHRIEASPHITLHPHTVISAFSGDEVLENIELTNNRTGEARWTGMRHAFIFIGATANTGWLPAEVQLDAKGFIRTGRELDQTQLTQETWPLRRSPYLLETSVPRVFAAGDVRSGSTKRVASAVGEGSVSVSFIHQALAE